MVKSMARKEHQRLAVDEATGAASEATSADEEDYSFEADSEVELLRPTVAQLQRSLEILGQQIPALQGGKAPESARLQLQVILSNLLDDQYRCTIGVEGERADEAHGEVSNSLSQAAIVAGSCSVVCEALAEMKLPHSLSRRSASALIIEAEGRGRFHLPQVTLEAESEAAMLQAAGWKVTRLKNQPPEQLQLAMSQARPTLVVVLAHTDITLNRSDPTIGFCDSSGLFHILDTEVVTSIMTSVKCVELVMLAGCKSQVLGDKLVRAGVPQVQCWTTLVHDTAAPIFGLAFLQCWLTGADAREAHRAGTAAVEGVSSVMRELQKTGRGETAGRRGRSAQRRPGDDHGAERGDRAAERTRRGVGERETKRERAADELSFAGGLWHAIANRRDRN